MGLKLIVPPVSEPLTVEQAKNWFHVDADDDLDAIEQLIVAAREKFEEVTNRKLLAQTWEYSTDQFPCDSFIRLPFAPISSVASLKYLDSLGEQTFGSGSYALIEQSEMWKVQLVSGASWPSSWVAASDAVKVRFVAGYEVVPTGIAMAINDLARQWFDGDLAVDLVPKGWGDGWRVFS
jgi:uncharacterized phiE125 gp8 family phage protein